MTLELIDTHAKGFCNLFGSIRSKILILASLNFDDSYSERVKGIEPSHPAWEAGVLPLYDTRSAAILKLKTHLVHVPYFIRISFRGILA